MPRADEGQRSRTEISHKDYFSFHVPETAMNAQSDRRICEKELLAHL